MIRKLNRCQNFIIGMLFLILILFAAKNSANAVGTPAGANIRWGNINYNSAVDTSGEVAVFYSQNGNPLVLFRFSDNGNTTVSAVYGNTLNFAELNFVYNDTNIQAIPFSIRNDGNTTAFITIDTQIIGYSRLAALNNIAVSVFVDANNDSILNGGDYSANSVILTNNQTKNLLLVLSFGSGILAGDTFALKVTASNPNSDTDGYRGTNNTQYCGEGNSTRTVNILMDIPPQILPDTPNIYIVSPRNNSDTSVHIILVSGTTQNSNIGDTIKIYVNGIEQSSYILQAANGSWQGTALLSGIGSIVSVKVFDNYDRENSDTIIVNYYSYNQIAITAPTNNTDTLYSNILISGTTLNSLIGDTINIYVNGNFDTQIIVSSANQNWQTLINVNSQNTVILAQLQSQLGYTASTQITINYYGAPQISITSPQNNHDTNSNLVTISGTSYNTLNGYIVYLYVNDAFANTVNISTTNGNWQTILNLSQQINKITAICADARNRTDSATIYINYYAAPQIKITSHQQNYISLDTMIVLSGTTTNTALGDTVRIYLNGSLINTIILTENNSNWQSAITLDTSVNNINQISSIITNKFNVSNQDTINIQYFNITTPSILNAYEDKITEYYLTSTINNNVVWSLDTTVIAGIMTLNISDTKLTIIPQLNVSNISYNFKLYAFYSGTEDSQILTINILNVNDTPIITSLPPTAVIGINQYYSYYIVATDTDFDRINFTLINAPAGMIIRDSEYLITAQNSICTALIEWRPQTSGVYNFSARVSDTSNAAALQNITISVINRPMNVYKLTAELTDLNNALLTWIETPETNIVNYQIYKSDNFGNLNFDSVYSIIAAPADSIVIQLNGDTMTKFSVLPINNVGLTADTLTAPVVIVYKNPNNISSVVWTKIVNPLNGFTVSGDYIQVRAELVKGNLSDIKSLAFYYKTEEEATWKLMKIYYTGIEKNIDNPLTNINTTDDLFINWNIKNLANGSYLIKSEATDKNNVVEPCPIAVKIVKGSNIVNSDYYFDAVSYPSPITAQTLIPGLKGDNEAVIISTQTNSVYGEAFNTKITVEIPGNAIDTTQPIGSQKIVMMPINETLMKDYNIKTPSADTAYANMVVLNVVDTQTLASGNLVNKILNHGTTQFNNKVRVKMSYLDKDGDGWLDNMRNIRQEWLRIYYRHNINDDWKSLPHDQLKINFEDNLAEFEIDHFTIFLLSPDTEFVRSVIASGLPITVYPNPYIPSKNNEQGRPFKTEYQNLNDADLGGIVFRNLGDTVTPATIKIFTLSGQLVREKITTTSYWIWDTKNDKGKEVASGWYLYLVEINGIKKTGKLAIIR